MFFKVVVVCLACLVLSPSADAERDVFRFYSEIAAPYYWLNEDDSPQGVNYDLATGIIDLLSLEATIEHLPWARAVHEAQQNPRVVLISVLKTPERQSQLQWLGHVHNVGASIIGLSSNSDIQLSQLAQAQASRIGTIRGYAAAEYLVNNGFTETKNLVLVSNSEQLWKLLFRKRIDYVLTNQTTARFELSNIGFDPQQVTVVLPIDALQLELQMATGHQTSLADASKLRGALEQLKANGEYQRIMQKWGL